MNSLAAATGKEIFDLLQDDLAAIEREFGSYSVSNVQAITEIGEYFVRAAENVSGPRCFCSPPNCSTTRDAEVSFVR